MCAVITPMSCPTTARSPACRKRGSDPAYLRHVRPKHPKHRPCFAAVVEHEHAIARAARRDAHDDVAVIGFELIGAGADARPGGCAQQRREDVVRPGIQTRRHHPLQRILRRVRRRPRRQDHHRRAQRGQKDLALGIDRAVMVDDVDIGRADRARDGGLDRLPGGSAGIGYAGHVAAREQIEAAVRGCAGRCCTCSPTADPPRPATPAAERCASPRRRGRSRRRRSRRRCAPPPTGTRRDRAATRSDPRGRRGSPPASSRARSAPAGTRGIS